MEQFLDWIMPTVLEVLFDLAVIALAMMFLFVTMGPPIKRQ